MSPGEAAGDVTVEELVQLVERLIAGDAQARCREGTGPYAPLAVALNQLSAQENPFTLRISEDTFGVQAWMTQSPNYMLTCDLDVTIRYINHTRPDLKTADVVGTNYFSWMTPETAQDARAIFERVRATGETGRFESQVTTQGEPHWYSSQVGPIKVGQELVGFTVIITSIDSIKRTQQRLERSNRELEDFAYVASHDLQEPLRKIQTFGERLKTTSAAALSDEGRDYIDRMQKAATRMRVLIDDLLAFSRLSSKSKPFAPVNLGAVARDVVEDLKAYLEKTSGHITVGELPELQADAAQMHQLLRNLLSNGLKFRREGVPPVLSVQASVDPRTQTCELRVEDNGIGFEEKYADRIFSVFQRLHGRGQYEGSGIGLAICRKIVERHEGRITARSTPGVGSTFLVTLPLKPRALL